MDVVKAYSPAGKTRLIKEIDQCDYFVAIVSTNSTSKKIGQFSRFELEYAVEQNWVHDEQSAEQWISGILTNSLCQTDLPIATRLYAAWQNDNSAQVQYWNNFLFACRESGELQQEDHQLGQ